MFSVTSEKLRSGGRPLTKPRTIRGYLLVTPAVGNTMVLFRESEGSRMVTTPVTRVMVSDDVLFVETENSVYRITVHGRVVYSKHEQTVVPLQPREVSRSAEFPAQAAVDTDALETGTGHR